MFSPRPSGRPREWPCTPSSWCRPVDIGAPGPRPPLDRWPHTWWRPAPSSVTTLWLSRSAQGQASCWRTLVPSHGAGCGKTPTWKRDKTEWIKGNRGRKIQSWKNVWKQNDDCRVFFLVLGSFFDIFVDVSENNGCILTFKKSDTFRGLIVMIVCRSK